MSKRAFTVKAFGIYLFCLGVALLLAPGLLLPLFGLPESKEVWIRVVGVLLINLGVYYWYAAISEARPFFYASVFTRAFVLITFTSFVLLGLAEPTLILFGAIDFLGGLWTFIRLRSERGDASGAAHPAGRI